MSDSLPVRVEDAGARRDLDMIEAGIDDIHIGTPPEIIAELRTWLEGMQHRIKQMLATMDQRMISYLRDGGSLEWTVDAEGHTRRFYLSPSKTTKCKDVRAVCDFMLRGDVNDMMDCLSANAWKPGAVKKLLERGGMSERYDQLFETVVRPKLDEDGYPVDELQSFDSRFLK